MSDTMFTLLMIAVWVVSGGLLLGLVIGIFCRFTVDKSVAYKHGCFSFWWYAIVLGLPFAVLTIRSVFSPPRCAHCGGRRDRNGRCRQV